MGGIPITGTPSNFRVPGGYIEVLFGQGPASAFAGTRDIVYVMPKTAAGTWAVNTVYEVPDEKTARTGAGVGSPAHRAARVGLMANRNARHYAVVYAATSGAAPAAATGTIVLANSATGSGVVSVWVAGELCQASFVSGDTVTAIGDALEASINAKDWLPCTALNAAGTVTLTAKIAGASQGDGTTGVIHMRGEITSGIGTTLTLSGAALGLGAGVDGAEGSTTEAANLETALATLDSDRKYYVVVSVWSTADLAKLKTHIATKSEPRPGLRSVGIAANTGALAACQTIATGLNHERLQIAWCKASEWDTASIAGNVAAIRQKREEVDAATNLDSYRAADWLVPPTHLQADWPSSNDQSDAINDGITPIATNSAGSYLVMSCTTRSKNAAGTVDDPRALETHRVSVADLFADEELAEFALNYANKKLKDDERLADGSVNTNQNVPPGVITPHGFKDHIRRRVDRFESSGLTQNGDASNESLRCVIDPNNGGRLQVGLDLEAINLLHQLTVRLAEVSTG
jgi:phage tail sheath gpL-like